MTIKLENTCKLIFIQSPQTSTVEKDGSPNPAELGSKSGFIIASCLTLGKCHKLSALASSFE